MLMKSVPLLLVLMVALTVVGGCSKKTQPAPSAPAVVVDEGATAAAAPAAQGTPQIVTEPDGVHIEYRVFGQGEPAILLIHGWATDSNYWNAQIKPLQAKYTVVAIDLAGHGASTRNRSDWSMQAYGQDVAAVAQQISTPRLILLGHSMGGTVALEAAHLIGNRVIGIIVVDALKSVGLPPLPRSEIEARVAPFRSEFIAQTRKYVAESLFPQGADPLFVQKVGYDMSLEPADVAVASLESLLGLDLNPIIREIHVPVLAINSDLAPTDAARIRKFLPGFKADVLPHTSHFLMMDAADRFNPVLLRDIQMLVTQAPH